MPGFDKSGPNGAGSMTGGAKGLCNPATAAYPPRFYRDAGFGKGMGFGQGFKCGRGRIMRKGCDRGFGLRPSTYGDSYPKFSSELDMLKTRAESFKNALDEIEQRVAELEKTS